jgi:hypothetical protein
MLCFLFSFAACSQDSAELEAQESASPAATEQPQETEQPTSTDEPEDEPDAVSEDGEAAEDAPTLDWQTIYTNFLTDNFSTISEQLYGSIAGIGFIDLDFDGTPELVLFDPGASASMGVQFFDITDASGTVECVSANILSVGETFGGDYLTEAYVNANYFEDFRLAENADGERIFYVNSGNGGIDFSYTELIEFGGQTVGDDGIVVLTLTSLLYRSDRYPDEEEGGSAEESEFTYMSERVSSEEYEAQLAAFNAEYTDTDYEARGVFMWEDKSYTTDLTGLMAMLDNAIAAYVPLPEA